MSQGSRIVVVQSGDLMEGLHLLGQSQPINEHAHNKRASVPMRVLPKESNPGSSLPVESMPAGTSSQETHPLQDGSFLNGVQSVQTAQNVNISQRMPHVNSSQTILNINSSHLAAHNIDDSRMAGQDSSNQRDETTTFAPTTINQKMGISPITVSISKTQKADGKRTGTSTALKQSQDVSLKQSGRSPHKGDNRRLLNTDLAVLENSKQEVRMPQRNPAAKKQMDPGINKTDEDMFEEAFQGYKRSKRQKDNVK